MTARYVGHPLYESKTMEIFKTTAVDGPTVFDVMWGASPTEAAGHRKTIIAHGYKPATQTINIPTAKGPLVAWLNANVKN